MQLNSSLLTISVIAVLLPGAFHTALQWQPEHNEVSTDYAILKTSHGVRDLVFVIQTFGLIPLYRLPLFSFSVGQHQHFLTVNSSHFQSTLPTCFPNCSHTRPFMMMTVRIWFQPGTTRRGGSIQVIQETSTYGCSTIIFDFDA